MTTKIIDWIYSITLNLIALGMGIKFLMDNPFTKSDIFMVSIISFCLLNSVYSRVIDIGNKLDKILKRNNE
jgi:hypothetical protein